jgi:phosphate transport system substrate-binding protein
MLTKEEPTGAVKEFIDFILSADGQAVVESHGYLKVNR